MFEVEKVSAMKKSLKDRAKEFSSQLPLMVDRQKGDAAELIAQYVTIADYGFMTGDNGHDYAVFTIKEDNTRFYFGGTVLSDQLRQLDNEGYADEIKENGLPILLTERKSKNGRKYTNVEFYPDMN